MDVKPGNIRSVMPTLAPQQSGSGGTARSAGATWERNVWRAQTQALQHLTARPENARRVSATSLAAHLQARPEHVEAVLERLRAQVECHLSVTRSGDLLHDFDTTSLAAFRTRHIRAYPMRLLLLATAIATNLGAAWPVISIALLAASGLHILHMIGVDAESFAPAKLMLWSIAGVLGVVVLMGLVFEYAFLKPRLSGPDLGPSLKPEPLPVQLRSALNLPHADAAPKTPDTSSDASSGTWSSSSSSSSSSGSSIWFFSGRSSSGSSSSSSSRSSSSSSDSDSKGGGWAKLLIFVLYYIVFVLVLVAALATVWVWGRGLWRAINRSKTDLENTSPALWIRNETRLDFMDRWIPTNDLAGHLIRTLRRVLTQRRPYDRDLGPRILKLSQAKGGTVSVMQVALSEALDPDEALEACAGLTRMFGGEFLVNDDGVIFCRFPPETTKFIQAHPDQDLYAEYLTFKQNSPIVARRPSQSLDTLPVNLVGLHHDHLSASNRLAAGAWLIPLSILVVFYGWSASPLGLVLGDGSLSGLPESQWALSHPELGFVLLCLGLLFAAATTAAATAARYAASASAVQGLLRDVRRAAVQEIHDGLSSGVPNIDLDGQVKRVADTLKAGAWKDLKTDAFSAEINAVVADYDLEPTVSGKGNMRYDIQNLRALLAASPLPTLPSPCPTPPTTPKNLCSTPALPAPNAKPPLHEVPDALLSPLAPVSVCCARHPKRFRWGSAFTR